MTPDQIAKSVSAAFDSVNLIDALNLLTTLTDEETSTLNRNVAHLRIMMDKDWFAGALTEEQTSIIDALIA